MCCDLLTRCLETVAFMGAVPILFMYVCIYVCIYVTVHTIYIHFVQSRSLGDPERHHTRLQCSLMIDTSMNKIDNSATDLFKYWQKFTEYWQGLGKPWSGGSVDPPP